MTEEQAVIQGVRAALVARGAPLLNLLDTAVGDYTQAIYAGHVPQQHRGRCVVIDGLVDLQDTHEQGRREIASFLVPVKALSGADWPHYALAEQIDIVLRDRKFVQGGYAITIHRLRPITHQPIVDAGRVLAQVGGVYRADVSLPL